VVKVGEQPRARGCRDDELVARLRAGDEAAFEGLVCRHHGEMVALARSYVRTPEVAEEVVQETWLAVLQAIDRFEGRSALKTWVFRILVNTAMTRGGREARTLPFSALESADGEGPTVDPRRFMPSGESDAGHWRAEPGDWRMLPEERLLASETIAVVRRAVEQLPPRQAQVIAMRDIAGFSPAEVSATLGVTRGNQRILLHRARAQVRTALERHLDG
jgi:RNA polymerase sigma-70 factor (ECF subfamily)